MQDEISEVLPGVFVSGLLPSQDLKLLRKRKIKTIISVVAGVRPKHPDCFRYIVVPIPDTPDVDIVSHAADAVAVIAECVKDGIGVLVHCHCGVSRSVSVVCLYIMRSQGIPFAQALEAVQRVRPQADPNKGFRHQLERLML